MSARTALILEREIEGQSETFEDYREIDGEQVPFRRTIRDALGDTTVIIRNARFNVALADAVFALAKPSPR